MLKRRTNLKTLIILLSSIMTAGLIWPQTAEAHCDSMNGPVVLAGQRALRTGNVNLVLLWVKEEQEDELVEAFKKARKLLDEEDEIKDMAIRHFLETLVRLHRASEGAPYTGLKPAHLDPGAVVKLGDQALETESLQELHSFLSDELKEGLHRHFEAMMARKEYDPNDVEAGRDFVHHYVEFMHYAEAIYKTLSHGNEGGHGH